MEQLAGRDVALQILITMLITRLANATPNAQAYAAELQQEALSLLGSLNITGESPDEVRAAAKGTVNEVFALLVPAT